MNKTRLSINLNKVALIRNSRGANYPDLVKVALDCERFGAEGITIHPRPDQRHARYEDIAALKAVIKTELNIEGNPIPHFLSHVIKNKPAQCTLVPDKPGALTSDSGWDTITHQSFLTEVIDELKSNGIRVSIFMNNDPKMIEGAKKVGADCIELYTGPYAANFHKNRDHAISDFIDSANLAKELDLGLNAGHDLNLDNLHFFAQKIPHLLEVSIGHALISDAIYLGLNNTIQQYLKQLSF